MSSIADGLSGLLLFLVIALPLLWQVSSRFRYAVKISALYACCFLCSVFAFFFVIWRPFDPENHRTVFWVFACLTPWVRVKWTVRGRHNFDDLPNGCVMMMNHQSSLDLHGLGSMWPERGIVLIKKSLMYAGMLGVTAWLSGSVFIDRFNLQSAKSTMDDSMKKIRQQRLKMLIFPEGTRNHGDGLLPFKKGGFHIAVQGGLPIVPVVLSSYKPFYSKNEWRWCGEGRVIVQVMPPIATEGLTADDITRLAEETRLKMLTVFEQISVEAAEMTAKANQD